MFLCMNRPDMGNITGPGDPGRHPLGMGPELSDKSSCFLWEGPRFNPRQHLQEGPGKTLAFKSQGAFLSTGNCIILPNYNQLECRCVGEWWLAHGYHKSGTRNSSEQECFSLSLSKS